ncbi:glycoside hydrolase family 108 protein [Caballeronia sp. LjRoot31]|uniref:glycoside hydrolase family 108 protein n=1 Tax=Caballeronia sp. LjRoot31 TaxID=3342324 RepID=UPI003ECCFE0E
MTADVDKIFEDLLVREGGGKVTNDPNDAGGLTRWGWTQKTASAYGFKRSVDTMTHDEAITLYNLRFWFSPKFDQLHAIDPDLAIYLADTAVTSGPATGVKFMQRALNVLNNQAKAFPDISADGGLGPMTFAALRAYVTTRGPRGLDVLRFMVRSLRSTFFIELAERKETQESFEYGWQVQRAMLGA